MQTVDEDTGARTFQTMVAMRDGTRLNTFVFLQGEGARAGGDLASRALWHCRVRRAR